MSGVMRCGLIWHCPVCAGKIRNERATVISEAAGRWQKAGNSVYMVTLTAPHDLGMRLSDLLVLIAESFQEDDLGTAVAAGERAGGHRRHDPVAWR